MFFGGYTLIKGKDSLVYHRHQHSIGYKAWIVAHFNGCLAELFRKVTYGFICLVACCKPTDYLHQRHQWHRVEEVHPNEPIRSPGHRSESGDIYGRGVGGKDRMWAKQSVEFLERRCLSIEILKDCLDDEVAVCKVSNLSGGGNSPKCGLALRSGHFTFL